VLPGRRGGEWRRQHRWRRRFGVVAATRKQHHADATTTTDGLVTSQSTRRQPAYSRSIPVGELVEGLVVVLTREEEVAVQVEVDEFD
jgi:hypothetical protein